MMKPTRTVKADAGQRARLLAGATRKASKGSLVIYERPGGGFIRESPALGGYKLEFFPAGCNCGA